MTNNNSLAIHQLQLTTKRREKSRSTNNTTWSYHWSSGISFSLKQGGKARLEGSQRIPLQEIFSIFSENAAFLGFPEWHTIVFCQDIGMGMSPAPPLRTDATVKGIHVVAGRILMGNFKLPKLEFIAYFPLH